MKKTIVLMLAAILLILSGCQGLNSWLFEDDTVPATPTEAPAYTPTPTHGPPRNDLFGVTWSGETVLQPAANDSRYDAQWLPLVYEGLFELDEAFQPQPLLCASYTTQDNKTFVFNLRAGVLFHDGRPLTAEDAAWSLNQAKKPGGIYAARLSGMLSARAVGENTLEVTLSRANPRLPALLTIPIVPAQSDRTEIAPGTGPYVPVLEEEFSHLAAFDGWWRRKQLPLSRLELVSVESGDQLINALSSRSISLTVYNPSDTAGVRFRGDYESWEHDTTTLEYIGFNTARAPTNNPLMRRALAASVDRETVGRNGADPRWVTPVVLPFPPDDPLFDDELAAAHGFDLARATALLIEMGYEDRDGDGLLESAGWRSAPLELTMVVCAENAHHVTAARAIADRLIGIGALIHLEELPFSAYLDALARGRFNLYYGAATLTADFSPLPFFAGGSLGYGGYRDAETLALWEEAAAETAGSQAKRDFWARFVEEAPIVPVLFQRQALLTQRGLTSDPHPVWENPFYRLAEWTIG